MHTMDTMDATDPVEDTISRMVRKMEHLILGIRTIGTP